MIISEIFEITTFVLLFVSVIGIASVVLFTVFIFSHNVVYRDDKLPYSIPLAILIGSSILATMGGFLIFLIQNI